MKIGLIVRADKTGLGNQTRNICEMLQPAKVLMVDSTPFNHNKQYPELYKKYRTDKVTGFPTNGQCKAFVQGIDRLVSCETFYNSTFVSIARQKGVKTYLQYNYEFLDYLNMNNFPIPDVLISPSYWHLEEVAERFHNVVHLPPPIAPEGFRMARVTNLGLRENKFLHIVGRWAVNDRNGTQDLLESLKYTNSTFTLTIKTQVPLPFAVNDPRVIIDMSNPEDEQELYNGYDALILPRRYGGLCLPMNEALLSGLPVVMTNISPNDKILPKQWLVNSTRKSTFFTRSNIDVYSVNHIELAKKMDWLCSNDLTKEKQLAYSIGMDNFGSENLKAQWMKVLK